MRNLSQELNNLSPEQRAILEAKLKARGIELPQSSSIEKREQGQPIPLSFAQQRLWFVQQLEPENNSYNVPCALKLEGKLDVDALAKTLNEIVKRHEILRTVFVTDEDKQPIQVVQPYKWFKLSVIYVGAQGLRPLNDVINETIKQPFDLSNSLLRIN